MTNAISGMTALGGMLLLAHGSSESSSLIPDSPAHWMGAIATLLSFINISGGFLITGKMLEFFRYANLIVWFILRLCVGVLNNSYCCNQRRAEDPDDYFQLYTIPSALLVGGLVASYLSGNNLESVSGSVGIASAICCIAASESLVKIKTFVLM